MGRDHVVYRLMWENNIKIVSVWIEIIWRSIVKLLFLWTQYFTFDYLKNVEFLY